MSLFSPPLQAFIAIVKHKTVHGAAAAIHLTQTAVTQRIRALEAKLRTTLFVRTRRGMMLTPEGEALLRYCHAVHEIEGEALAQIKGAGVDSKIQLCISGPTSIMRSRIIPQCFPVMKKFPNLLLHFDIDDVVSGVKGLRSGANQFAVIAQEEVAPEMASKLLKPERYVLVCTKGWKKRKLRDIIKSERIVDYDPSDQMTFNYLKHFNLFDLARHDRHFANRTESMAAMLIAGFGYGTLTTEFSKPYLDAGELIALNSGKIYENTVALAWYSRPEPPPYFSALIHAIL
jgi:LysR family transcriptional regulator (chromosome initiation inhibitor)